MIFVAAILDFGRPSWIDNGYFLTMDSTYTNDHLDQFWCFYHKVNDRQVFLFFFCTNLQHYLEGSFLILTL